MRSERRKKLTILIMLLIGVCSISIGFAAYSTSLKIESGLAIAPDESAFSVKFSSSATSLETKPVSPSSKSTGLEATDAIINNSTKPTIGGYRATFTKVQQYVTYSFYVRNTGHYTAYLNSIGFSGDKNCVAKPGTSESSVSENCGDVSVRTTVKVGNIKTTESMLDIIGETLTPNESKLVEVTFEYFGGGKFIDGDFSIEFPEITLYYASTGGINGSFGDESDRVTLTSNTDTLVLSDVASKQLANYRIYGSSEGVGTRNLFDISKIPTTSSVLNNGDGSLTLKAGYSADTIVTLAQVAPELKVGDVVTLSGQTNAYSKKYNEFLSQIYLYGVNITWKFGSSLTITQPMLDSRVILYRSQAEDGTTSESRHWDLQIEYGTVATKYQPYDPTGNYVVPITVRGKNLFNVNGITNTSSVYVENNIIYSNNYGISLRDITQTLCPSLINGDTIVLSADTNAINNGTKMDRLYYYSSVTLSSKRFGFNEPFTVTNDFLNSRLVFYNVLQDGVGSQAYYKNMQIEKGTTATPYEPYVPATTINVEMSRPLMDGEYIDFKEQKLVRRNGTKEDINLPAITTFSVPTTIIEVETGVIPTMIEVSYFK